MACRDEKWCYETMKQSLNQFRALLVHIFIEKRQRSILEFATENGISLGRTILQDFRFWYNNNH